MLRPGELVLRASLEALPRGARDEWLDSLLGLKGLPADGTDLPRGCVPYLPCPVEVLLRAVDRAEITSEDVFVDVGSGVGRAAALVHLLTGAGAVGVEVQQELVRQSRELAAALEAPRFATVAGDAAELLRFLPTGTVFFLYCPFSGARLERVFEHLEDIARTRTIRVCCVQMPALARPWLEPLWEDEELSIYRSRAFTVDLRSDAVEVRSLLAQHRK